MIFNGPNSDIWTYEMRKPLVEYKVYEIVNTVTNQRQKQFLNRVEAGWLTTRDYIQIKKI